MGRVIERTCSLCGEEIHVPIEEDGTYPEDYFYTTFEVPADDAEIVEERDSEHFEFKVVEYSEYKEIEYWECPDCYELDRDDDR